MASKNVVHVDDANFQKEVIESSLPVLVDFWAEWCGPCRMVAPTIDQLADEYVGKVKIAKCDTEAAHHVPAKYGIRGIPTLILFHNGVPVDQVVGAVPKPVLAQLLDTVTD
ncbi:MAG: thioredoxin [Nitrospinae bacterium]|nr:thioredoxin [Nitrospinota bacterium]